MRSISSRRARLFLEVLQERCLLSYGLGSTVQVSQDDPFATCTADDIQHQSGTLYPGTSLETFLVSDPTNPDHLAGTWQQDRWSTGGSRGLEVGISFDGGQTWLDQPLPGAGTCSGGTTQRASDPWIAFGPDGTLYAAILTVSGQGSPGNVLVSRSTDGGLTWQGPVLIPNSGGADKESIMTDPSNPSNVYVVWTGAYSVSTNGGQSFSPARSLATGSGSQIVVLPDGTLVDSDGCEIYRSTDQGQTWGYYNPFFLNCDPLQVTDPNTHQSLRAGLGLGDIAVDPNSGALYVVIEDAGVGGGVDGVAFSQSLDGGFTWSTPVKANQTPTNIPRLEQQAFIPTVQVAADGTVGVTYYDFRFNQEGSQNPLLTDYWFVSGTPDGLGGITWGEELRLTDQSFNFEDAPFSVYGKFLGDYQGRASAGLDMLNLFGYPPSGPNGDAIYFRRVINLGNGPDGASGHLGSTAQGLDAILRIDPAGASFPVSLAPDSPTTQPLPVDVPALAGLYLDNPVPLTTQFALDVQALKHVAPLPSSDGAVPVSEGIDPSALNGIF
jgi:hypothetical protein